MNSIYGGNNATGLALTAQPLNVSRGAMAQVRNPSDPQAGISALGAYAGPDNAGMVANSPRRGGGGMSGSECCQITPDFGLAHEQDVTGENWHRTMSGAIPTYIDATGGTQLLNPDYLCLGSVAQARAANLLMHGIGTYDPRSFAGGLVDPSTYEVGFGGVDPNPNFFMGVQIDWGIALGQFAPFDLQISTRNWIGAVSRANLDRNLTVRVDGSRLGGRILLPAAYRNPTGMMFGQIQLAVYPFPDEVPTQPVVIFSALPAGIAPNFSASVQIITAFTRQTKQFDDAIGVYVGG